MSAIPIRQFCEALYCGYTAADALTPDAAGRIEFVAEVTDGAVTAARRARFDGVRGLTRRSERPRAPEPGDRLELSVIEVEREAAGWRVWLNPWYLEEIEFRCDAITLDGDEVAGTERWLQDELPRRAG